MKKVGDLFAELGFRENGSESTKRAFIENLVKAAGGVPRSGAVEAARAATTAPKTPPAKLEPGPRFVREEQLSFDFSFNPETPFPLATKKTAG